jgi:hypothetical protein
MLFAHHTPRPVRFSLAAGVVCGEQQLNQRSYNPDVDWRIDLVSAEREIQSGAVRTSPA